MRPNEITVGLDGRRHPFALLIDEPVSDQEMTVLLRLRPLDAVSPALPPELILLIGGATIIPGNPRPAFGAVQTQSISSTSLDFGTGVLQTGDYSIVPLNLAILAFRSKQLILCVD